ncbi:hypothetical protein [Paenibacillus alvei]|uniref:hypothetical protein n=1 Tax=Paenibacillus alvei TaxID=44250 RepID=UPI0013DCF95B|nr:hypothetical protein [Paenibacillus alvei]NEZ40292.1 hypothetical protein [Paenibacillus alvei]
MMQDFARLDATLGKMTIVDETTAKIEMTFSVKDAQKNFMFLTGKQKQKVIVALGDPQMVMQFSEEEMLRPFNGRYYTADQSGVVTNVQRKDEENDENQGDLFSPIKSEGEEGPGEEIEENAASGDEASDADSSGDNVEQVDCSSDDSADSDTPEWMREGDDTEVSFESEQSEEAQTGMVEEDGEQHEVTTESQNEEDSKEGTSSEVGKEELEQFILQHRPSYEDLPLDFPALLEKRLQENKTWREIANEAGMTSGQLSSRWSMYKKRVAEQMKDGGAA